MHRIYLFLVLLSILASCSYLPDELPDNQNLIIEENADYIKLSTSTSDNSLSGIIFYPGGLVDPHAYVNALTDLALLDNRTVVILKVAANLAILNSKKASKIITEFPAISNWVVGGHSLGGAVACMDVFDNAPSFQGLFLMGAYSVNDLSDRTIPILSITGSEDLVLDQAKFQENNSNLPPPFIDITSPLPTTNTQGFSVYYEVMGGNHAQFGDYGAQEGDGNPTITTEQQKTIVSMVLRNFLAVNQL